MADVADALGLTPEIEDMLSLDDADHRLKIERLRRAVSGIVERCSSQHNVSPIIQRLQKIISYRQEHIAQRSSLDRPGFRLLMTGIPFPINSGVVTVMKNIIKAFEQNGANVAIINHWWHKYSYYDASADDYAHVRISPYSLIDGNGNLIEMRWAFKKILNDLARKHNYRPDICHVHTHTFYEDKAIQIFGEYFPATPIVYTLHAFIPFVLLNREERLKLLSDQMTREEIEDVKRRGYKGRNHAQDGMIRLANKIITISQVHKDAFDRLYPEFKDKCVCIPNGTDFELYSELEEVVDKARELRSRIAPNNERIVIFVGRLEAQKGAEKLVQGFNLIATKYHDAKLVIIGEDGSKLETLGSYGLKREFFDRVHLAGWVKDRSLLASYYRIADVMVQPVSSRELYAMATLEAMTLRVPVISCPGTLTVGNCESPESILSAVDIIFNNPQSIQRHLDNVREVVIKNYSLKAVYEKHLALYSQLCPKL